MKTNCVSLQTSKVVFFAGMLFMCLVGCKKEDTTPPDDTAIQGSPGNPAF